MSLFFLEIIKLVYFYFTVVDVITEGRFVIDKNLLMSNMMERK